MIAIKNILSLALFACTCMGAIPPEPTGPPSIDCTSASLNGVTVPGCLPPTTTSFPTSFTSFPTSFTSHHTSSFDPFTSCHRRSSRCKPTHHHKPTHCKPTHHHKPTHCKPTHHHKREHCCPTTTYTTCYENKTCCIMVWPCTSNNVTYYTTVTSAVAPVTAAPVAVAPVNQQVCVPCTSYVTVTSRPSMACTTMIFCDIADQSENCRRQNEMDMEAIAEMALREGGQVFVNGELVVFEKRGNSTVRESVTSSRSLVTVTGLNSNDGESILSSMSLFTSILSILGLTALLAV